MNNQYKSVPIKPSEITPYSQYLSRRDFLKVAGIATGSALLAACTPIGTETTVPAQGATVLPVKREAVSSLSTNFNAHPWSVEVYGMLNKPKTYAIEDVISQFTQEERIYRLRCVEGWSMVIPWNGFKLSSLLKEVEPASSAKFVRFETLMDKKQFPREGHPLYPWPYTEGLRLDEAMNDLTILATGLYGQPLPTPDGAPIRLVVPWKYGFKSIKSIVKIELVDRQPETLWRTIAPNEYGFYSNVNPNRPHPRWSQASERRIGELKRRPTLMFNGYAEQVAYLYEGMDLNLFY